MPIVVVCPCGAKLKAPDAAAGKRVKCPKCGTPLGVPVAEAEYEEVNDEPAPPPAKKKPMLVDDDELPPTKKLPKAGKKKPEPVEVDEAVDDDEEPPKKKRRRDDDESDDDAPKKKGKKGKKKEEAKSKLPLILGIGGGVFVLLTVVGIVVGVMMSGNGSTNGTQTKQTGPPPPPPLPAGWSTFKGDGFSVAVPDAIQFKEQDQGPNRPGRPPAGTKAYTNGVQPQVQPGGGGPPVHIYAVSAGALPPDVAGEFAKSPEAGWEAIRKQGGVGGQLKDETTIRVGGVEGRQYTLNAGFVAGVVRVAVKGEKVYSWVVMSQVAPAEDAPEVKPFFDTFKID